MSEKLPNPSTPPSTEDVPRAEIWLDALDDSAALRAMLASQGAAAVAVESALEAIGASVKAVAARLAGSAEGRLIYAGAGTSARIGVQDGVELPPTFGWDAARLGYLIAGGAGALMQAVEGAEDNADAAARDVAALGVHADDVVIGIAASGRTPYTIAVLTAARGAGALTIGMANNRATPLLDAAEVAILLETGGEVLAGSTRLKAATAQKIAVNMLSTLVMTRLGRVRNGLMVAMRPSNAKLKARKSRIDRLLSGGGGGGKTAGGADG